MNKSLLLSMAISGIGSFTNCMAQEDSRPVSQVFQDNGMPLSGATSHVVNEKPTINLVSRTGKAGEEIICGIEFLDNGNGVLDAEDQLLGGTIGDLDEDRIVQLSLSDDGSCYEVNSYMTEVIEGCMKDRAERVTESTAQSAVERAFRFLDLK